MYLKKVFFIISLIYLLIACNQPKEQKQAKTYEVAEKHGCKLHTYQNSTPHKVYKIETPRNQSEPKNVILIIGDGMGLSVVYSAWTANRGQLFLDNATYTGLMKTTAQDSIITDSAASGTAMSTGHKTNRGYVGVNAQGNSLKSICEYAKQAGLSTGVMSTCRITDATPATFSIENIDRNAAEDIAVSYVDSNIDFLLGGGKEYFDTRRKDGKNLLPLFKEKGYQVITSMDSLENIQKGKVFAVVADHDMPLAPERGDDLWKGTKKALDLLSQNKKGFFLMVESAMIDDFGHGNKLPEMMEETLDLDRTVGKVYEWVLKHPETLVIVTADHSTGGLTLTEGILEQGLIKGYYSNGHHNGVVVPVYAFGARAENFTGLFDNTDLCKKMKTVLGFNR